MKPKSISNVGELHVRISKIRQDFCYKNNMEFAKKIGANVSHASGICSGSKLAGPETLEKILAAFPQVNRSWLYFGEGEMLKSTTQKESESEDSLIEQLKAQLAEKDRTIETLQAYVARLEKTLHDYED